MTERKKIDVSEEETNKIFQAFKQRIGMNNSDFNKFISGAANRKIILSKEMHEYKIIAEVTESKYCGAGCEVGQKYIFQTVPNMLLVNESNCPLCIKALGPVSELMHGFWDRMIEGLNPNEGMWQYAHCLDKGIEYGGLGHVVFKVYAQKTT